MNYLFLLLSSLLLANTAHAQLSPILTPKQLWQALRQHSSADRHRVDLLNQLADDENSSGLDDEPPENRRDSLAQQARLLAQRLRYPAGEAYARFLRPEVPKEQRDATWWQHQMLPMAERAGDKHLLIRTLQATGWATGKAGLPYLRRATQLARALGPSPWLSKAYYQEAMYFERVWHDYYRGLQAISQQLRAAQQARLPTETASALLELGGFYRDMGDYDQARTYYERALQARMRSKSPRQRVEATQDYLAAVGGCERAAGRYPQALTYYQRALPLATTAFARLLIQSRIADVYERQHDPQALDYARQVLRQLRAENLVYVRQAILLTLGHYYVHAGRADSAVVYSERARQRAFEWGIASGRDAMQLLAQAYALDHRYAQAYTYQGRYMGLRDTLSGEQTTRRITALRFSQDLTQQQGRIALLLKSQQLQAAAAQRQRGLLLTALGGLLLLGGATVVFWRLNQQKQRSNTLLSRQKAQIEEQAARLSELDAAKSQFFANVSHELRTPLTLVLGPLDTLLTNPARPLGPAVRPPVALAHRQAQRLLQLVNRILDLTKLQAGRLGLHPTPTRLAPLLRRVVAQFESLANQRGITLAGPGALLENLHLMVDAAKVEEILTNLLINALNHTPAGGTVSVQVALAGGSEDGYAVTVRDTGPGIDPAEQTRVFERFYQSPQREAQGGTGLGLALSRELATLLGGTLTLQSAPGQGAAFTLRFPAPALPAEVEAVLAQAVVAPEASPPPPSSVPAPASGGLRARILVVEDQPDLREYLRGLLASDYEVLTAADGQAALAVLAKEGPVELIMTDAMMPRLSGLELLTQVRATPTLASLPILMLTARADEAYRLAALTTGVDDYLTKPFTTAELLVRVRTLLARYQVRRQFTALPAETTGLTDTSPLELCSSANPAGRAQPVPKTASAAEQLAQWQTQVAAHLRNEDFGPAELASLLLLSERTLYRRLGELAGLTPAAWLRELRLTHARQLLEAGNFDSVAEVATAAGFGNVKSFSQRYAERFGRRPSEYRRREE